MTGVISLLIVLVISIVINRVATIALTYTGMSRESARFQARSAFTGVGFTTREAETVVNHPVRRRILMMLMLIGNAGIVSVIASMIVALVNTSQSSLWYLDIFALVVGLSLLWAAAQSNWLDRRLSRLIGYMLKRYTDIEVRDYAGLLHIGGDYKVMELRVRDEDWLADKTLAELRLRDEGVQVLGVQSSDGSYLGVPVGETRIEANDLLVVYGRQESLRKLDQRRKGFAGAIAHQDAIVEQKQTVRKELAEHEAREKKMVERDKEIAQQSSPQPSEKHSSESLRQAKSKERDGHASSPKTP